MSRYRIQAIEEFTAGELTKDEKSEPVDKLDTRKLDISFKLKEAEQRQSFRETDIEFAINFMEQVDKQWAAAGYALFRCGVLRINSCARPHSTEPGTYAQALFVLVPVLGLGTKPK